MRARALSRTGLLMTHAGTTAGALLLLAAAVMLAMTGAATAADLAPPPAVEAPAAPSSPSREPRANGLHDADAACIEWTDGCRVCRRGANNEFGCSNIGFACQPEKGRCTRR